MNWTLLEVWGQINLHLNKKPLYKQTDIIMGKEPDVYIFELELKQFQMFMYLSIWKSDFF